MDNFEVLTACESLGNFNHPGDWIEYYRRANNITRSELVKNLHNVTWKTLCKIELKELYPNKDISMQLAKYFKLQTKYFHDEYFEFIHTHEHDLHIILYNYRKSNNLTLKEIGQLICVHWSVWSNWEKQIKMMNRKSYNKLKKLGII
ncbi:helix-turn-helix domain-containing protein [Clostridium senegalense]